MAWGAVYCSPPQPQQHRAAGIQLTLVKKQGRYIPLLRETFGAICARNYLCEVFVRKEL